MSGGREFFGCYLLESKNPKAKGRSYIGFTVNPRRRIRQHNGEIVNGAAKTKRWRPWEMVLVVYGFPTQVQALQFEWSWQHPERSLDIRAVAVKLGRKKRYGVQGKVLLLMEMLRTEPWCYYPLTLQFLSSRVSAERGRCPPPPLHMPVLVAPMEALPEVIEDATDPAEEDDDEEGSEGDEGEEGATRGGAGSCDSEEPLPEPSLGGEHWPSSQLQYGGGGGRGAAAVDLTAYSFDSLAAGFATSSQHVADQAVDGAAAPRGKGRRKAAGGKAAAAVARALSACMVCSKAASRTWALCGCCGKRSHVECLAREFLTAEGSGASIPTRGQCPSCAQPMVWMEVLAGLQNAGWDRKKRPAGKAAATAAAASAEPGGSAAGSPAAAAAGGKQKGPRGRKAAATAAASDGEESQLAGGAAAVAGRGGSKPRGRRKAAPAAAAAEPPRVAEGSAQLDGLDLLGANTAEAAAAAPAKRRGRPRKAIYPALPPADAVSLLPPPQQAPQQQRRRKQQAPPAAGTQLQQERAVWGATAAPSEEPFRVLEAAPWEDFDMGYEPDSPTAAGGGFFAAATAAGAARVAPGTQPPDADVVILSDSDDEAAGGGSMLLPLAQRLQRHHVGRVRPAGQQEEQQQEELGPSPQASPDSLSPDAAAGSPSLGSVGPAVGAGAGFDSPPTHRLGRFHLASPSPSPPDHLEQQQQQQQQVEVIELMSPSPLPLRDRLQQGPHRGGLLAPQGPAFPSDTSLGQAAAAVALEGRGPGEAPLAGTKPKRSRAFARYRRPQQQQQPQAPGLGGAPPAKGRALASPRGTPSPAPLRKRVQQEGGGGAGRDEQRGFTGAPLWQPQLGEGLVNVAGGPGSGAAGQWQPGRAGGSQVPACCEDDVIVISD